MHIYFSGIGGTAIGPLALIAKQAGYQVSGSDKQDSAYIAYLRKKGLDDMHIGQDETSIAKIHAKNPIDWFVYSSAVSMEQNDHPEIRFCQKNGIKISKRDTLINTILRDHHLKLAAVAGTHGKTTTTAMLLWLSMQSGLPVSYSLGAKSTFAEMGAYEANSQYFIYECDEYDRNFLAFKPYVGLITGMGWDHPDIFPTQANYNEAFVEFISQCQQTYIWEADAIRLSLEPSQTTTILPESLMKDSRLKLAGAVNRRNAWLVLHAFTGCMGTDLTIDQLLPIMNAFPGIARRFEQIASNLVTDYAHTPEKIQGAIQMALETNPHVVVVYEGLHNTRQHFIKHHLKNLFNPVDYTYVVPSYLAREDASLKLLEPSDIVNLFENPTKAKASLLNDDLLSAMNEHLKSGALVLCLSAGGGGSLDEWLRRKADAGEIYKP